MPSRWTVRGIVADRDAQARRRGPHPRGLPGLMDAMTMGFETADLKLLDGLAPGDAVAASPS